MKKSAILTAVSGTVALAMFALLGAGCGTQTQSDPMAEEVTKGERPVAMKGEGAFLDGKLSAVATISRGFDRQGKGGPLAPGARGERGARDGEIKGRRGDGITEVYSTGGDSEEEQKAAMEEYVRMAKARRAAGSPMPPVTLRVGFENRGTEPIELEVTEVNSDLGNFAVRPPKLTIAPGEKAVLEPMVSQLGVTSDEIPLKVAVRTGGKKELQVIVVKSIIAPSLRK